MAFGNKSTGATRNWKFGAMPPCDNEKIGLVQDVENRDLFEDQAWLGHLYTNELRKLELQRRDECRDVIRQFDPRLAEVQDELANAREELDLLKEGLKVARKETRKRIVASGDAGDRIKELKAKIKALSLEEKPRRVAAYANGLLTNQLKEVDERDRVRRKRARKESGLYWGTYLAAEQAAQAFRKGRPPKPKRYSGDGRIVVQFQKGISWESAIGCRDKRIRIELLERYTRQHGSRPKWKARVWLRAGSEKTRGRGPLWVVVPAVIHRIPPPGTLIKWAHLHRRLLGSKLRKYTIVRDGKPVSVWRPSGLEIGYSADPEKSGATELRPTGSSEIWQVMLTLSHRDPDVWRPDGQTTDPRAPACGVDLGFRLMQDGLRVAALVGQDGSREFLTLPLAYVKRWKFGARIQSAIDNNFNVIRTSLQTWLASRDQAGQSTPNWLLEAVSTMPQWQSPERMVGLFCAWLLPQNRFDGDESMFSDMAAWRRQHWHLSQWARHEAGQLRGQRESLYHHFASRVRRKYRLVCLENIDWRTLMTKRETDAEGEQEDELVSSQREQARIAAPGELAEFLRGSVFESVAVPSFDTTRNCSKCGHLNIWDQAAQVNRTCSKCGTTWDQDCNAAENLLREGLRIHNGNQPGGIGLLDDDDDDVGAAAAGNVDMLPCGPPENEENEENEEDADADD